MSFLIRVIVGAVVEPINDSASDDPRKVSV
jgi:hypothetical protein